MPSSVFEVDSHPGIYACIVLFSDDIWLKCHRRENLLSHNPQKSITEQILYFFLCKFLSLNVEIIFSIRVTHEKMLIVKKSLSRVYIRVKLFQISNQH